ncbi:MAG: hypothetical protein IPF52_14305 [Saprospiraceae bacterium]|nr:hypothetical protein [Saprospiraceae bacterium]
MKELVRSVCLGCESCQETGLPVIVEVANEDHVDLCIPTRNQYFLDRGETTANPFAVPDCRCRKRKDVTVFIKPCQS